MGGIRNHLHLCSVPKCLHSVIPLHVHVILGIFSVLFPQSLMTQLCPSAIYLCGAANSCAMKVTSPSFREVTASLNHLEHSVVHHFAQDTVSLNHLCCCHLYAQECQRFVFVCSFFLGNNSDLFAMLQQLCTTFITTYDGLMALCVNSLADSYHVSASKQQSCA